MADVLILSFDGADDSTTFTDSRPSPKTVTAEGDAKLKTATKKYGTASGYFDGTGDYLTVPASADWNFGTGDFTIELWVNSTQTTLYATLFCLTWSSGSHWQIMNGSGTHALDVWANAISGGAPIMSSTATVHDGGWHHVAWVRYGNVHTLYVDGVSQATVTNAAAIGNSTGTLSIGRDETYGPRYFNGYIDDLRITNGTARYTADFSASLPGELVDSSLVFGYINTLIPGRGEILELTYAGFKYGDNTTWSLSCDDATSITTTTEDKGNSYFQPTGSIYLTYGAANSATVQKFGLTSVFYPAGAYVYLPTGAGAVAAYTDFTLEFWINVATVVADTSFTLGIPLYSQTNTFLNGVVASPSYALATWHHVAICRKGNILRYYLNGAKWSEAVSTSALTLTGFGGTAVRGSFYLDSIGFSNSYAHYDSADFPVVNTPFYNIPSSHGVMMPLVYSVVAAEASGTTITPVEADGQWNKTVLLIQGVGEVGSKNIVDAKGRTIYNQSDVVYSDAQRKHLATSMYFNGSSAKLAITASRNLDLIDGDFTIELWIYPTLIQNSYLVSRIGGVRACFGLELVADGTIKFSFWDSATSTTTNINGPASVTVNTWSFVSVCKYGQDYRVWVNGVGGTIVTTVKVPNRDADLLIHNPGYGGDYRSWDSNLVIGASYPDDAYPDAYFKGFMEDIRITNGFARYTNVATYATPIVNFLPSNGSTNGDPYWSDVVLLFQFDEPPGTVYNLRDAKGHTFNITGLDVITKDGQYGSGFWPGQPGIDSQAYVSYGSEFDLSTGDFTIEAWCSGMRFGVVCGNSYGLTNTGWVITVVDATDPGSTRRRGYLQWTQWNSSGVQDIAISPLYVFYGERERWHHIAVTRKGNDIFMHVDGIGATTTITRRPAYTTANVHISGYLTSKAFFNYDSFRITRVARYTADFKVPTGRFPEVAFSYGNAVVQTYYSFIPGSVRAAATVPGAIASFVHSVTPPLIIGRPKVLGPTFGHAYSVVASTTIKGGEGIPEEFTFTDTPNAGIAFTHTHNVRFTDEVIAQAVRNLTSRFAFGGSATAMLRSVQLSDGLTFQSAIPPVRMAVPISDAIEVSSSAVPALGVIVAARIDITDTNIVARGQVLSEVIALSMPVGPTSHRLVTADIIAMTGTSAQAAHGVAADTLALAETTATKANFTSSLTDAVAFNDTPSLTLILTVTVADDVALNDIPAQQLLFSVIMQDGMQFSTLFTSPVVTAWAMNVRNAAVTQYSNFQYNSFAKMGERYLGANDQGLWWMDGTLDGTRPVNSRITTGIIQPNGNKLAGVQYAYLGMRGTGQFTVTVTDEAGSSYNYTLNAVDMETSRVVFGRGFRTRYFTFSLESKGQDFDLDNIEFVTSDISRKLQR